MKREKKIGNSFPIPFSLHLTKYKKTGRMPDAMHLVVYMKEQIRANVKLIKMIETGCKVPIL